MRTLERLVKRGNIDSESLLSRERETTSTHYQLGKEVPALQITTTHPYLNKRKLTEESLSILFLSGCNFHTVADCWKWAIHYGDQKDYDPHTFPFFCEIIEFLSVTTRLKQTYSRCTCWSLPSARLERLLIVGIKLHMVQDKRVIWVKN